MSLHQDEAGRYMDMDDEEQSNKKWSLIQSLEDQRERQKQERAEREEEND